MRIIGGRMLRGRGVRLIFERGGTGDATCEVEAEGCFAVLFEVVEVVILRNLKSDHGS